MSLSENGFANYRKMISKLSKEAQDKIAGLWSRAQIELGGDPEKLEAFYYLVAGIVDRYGNAASTLAANLYRFMREDAIGAGDTFDERVYGGQFDATAEKAKNIVEGGSFRGSEVASALAEMVDCTVKNYARRTIEENCHRDKRSKGFQVVPSGPTTCSFCTMQAGRGIIYDHDLKNMREPYHPHCNCQPIPVWKDLPKWFDKEVYSAKYHAAAEAYDSGDYSDELKERIARERATKGKDFTSTNAIMAVMREMYADEGMK